MALNHTLIDIYTVKNFTGLVISILLYIYSGNILFWEIKTNLNIKHTWFNFKILTE